MYSFCSRLLATFNAKKMCSNIVSKLVHLPERQWEGNSDSKKTLCECCSRHDSSLAKSRCSKTRRQFPKHKIGSNITRLISVCFSFDLLYGFWDLIFKWKWRFLPNHRILEAVSKRRKLYWSSSAPAFAHLLLLKIYTRTARKRLHEPFHQSCTTWTAQHTVNLWAAT